MNIIKLILKQSKIKELNKINFKEKLRNQIITITIYNLQES